MAMLLDSVYGVTLPSWSTGGRPASPNTGEFGFNSTLSKYEFWNGSSWTVMG
jgi:hypothetical protein